MVKTLVILAAIAGSTLYIARKLAMNQTELTTALNDTTARVTKIGTETRTLLDKVQELTDAINNGGEVTPEVAEALSALQAQVAVVDDLVPDAEQPAP